MISEIPAVVATLKTAKDFAKAVIDSKVSAALREQAIEFQFAIMDVQTAILDIQTKYQLLLQEKDALKQKLIDLEQWGTDAAKYELKELGAGVFAYAFQPDEGSTTPSHWLCAKCYQDKEKSILQKGLTVPPLGTIYSCPRSEGHLIYAR